MGTDVSPLKQPRSLYLWSLGRMGKGSIGGFETGWKGVEGTKLGRQEPGGRRDKQGKVMGSMAKAREFRSKGSETRAMLAVLSQGYRCREDFRWDSFMLSHKPL